MQKLERLAAERLQRRYARLVGRGTTACYVALRALAMCSAADTPGAIILPDLICSHVLDAVLLAGFRPVFADVLPARWTLDPASVQDKRTPETRGVLVAHLFGHVAEVASFGLPLIEDAVQGLGGVVGTRGDLTFISFDQTKMIGGRGGVVLTDDPTLWKAIRRVSLTDLPAPPPTEAPRYRAYRRQLAAKAHHLIRPFDESIGNIEQIEAGWTQLAANVRERNEKAARLHAGLVDLPLMLAEIRPGDAIWRYTFAAPNAAFASWVLRHLQRAGLSGSSLYPPLSTIFTPEAGLFSATLVRRLVNLWVDGTTSTAQLDEALAVVRAGALVMSDAPFR